MKWINELASKSRAEQFGWSVLAACIGTILLLLFVVQGGASAGDWVTRIIAIASVVVALLSRRQSKRSADAAEISAGIAKRDAVLRRYGWVIELNQHGTQPHILRNTGSVAATNVRFIKNDDFVMIRFRDESAGTYIAHSESREFLAATHYGSRKSEIQVAWVPEGEESERIWTSAVVFPPDPRMERTLEEQRADRIRAHQNAISENREITSRLISLGDAYSAFVADPENAALKLRVQLLVASLPSWMAVEVGREVDVARDLRQQGPGLADMIPPELQQWKQSIKEQAPQLELIWNMMSVNDSSPGEGHSHRFEYNIWDVGAGAATRIERRESGEWPTRLNADDRKHREELQRGFATMNAEFAARREELGIPDPFDDTDAVSDDAADDDPLGTS